MLNLLVSYFITIIMLNLKLGVQTHDPTKDTHPQTNTDRNPQPPSIRSFMSAKRPLGLVFSFSIRLIFCFLMRSVRSACCFLFILLFFAENKNINPIATPHKPPAE